VAAAPLLRDLPLFQERGAEVLKVVPFRRAKIVEILDLLETLTAWSEEMLKLDTETLTQVLKLGALPDPWPPDFSGLTSLEWYDDARAALVDALAAAGTGTPTWTFSPRDPTSAFWHRRMAHETVVHRIDVEQAHDAVSPIDPELALDGIDEILYPTLGGPWWEEGDTAYPIDATVRLTAVGRSWTVQADATSVDVRQGADGDAAAEISGDPAQVYLWLWGRAGEDTIEVVGDPTVVRAFRGRISEASQ